MNYSKKKIIVILGPTACGKTKLAVELARKFNGEIVSADSRQVYKGMDIGTGKDLKEYSVILEPRLSGAIESYGKADKNQMLSRSLSASGGLQHDIIKIPYHLIDIASPKECFDLASYQKLAFRAIDDILSRGKLPILVGGSGLYLQAVVDNFKLANAQKDCFLRQELAKHGAGELFEKLKKIAPKMAAKLNQSDKNNKRRLVRYLEILEQDKDFKSQTGKKKYDALLIGVKCSREILKQRIAQRLIKRLKEQNLIGEVASLRGQGLSWKRLESFGLEYKFISFYLQKKISYEEMVEKLNIAINQFSKRQLTWFNRWEKQGARINWLKDGGGAAVLVRKFIK